MTKEYEAFIQNLNTFGSDIEPPEIQAIIDHEHALADPMWAERKEAEKRSLA